MPIKPTAQSSETPRLPASKGTTEDGKSTSKVSNKPTAQSSQTRTPRLTASKGTTDDGKSTASKVSIKPTDQASQTETPRLVSGGAKAAPEPEISKGVSSPTTNVLMPSGSRRTAAPVKEIQRNRLRRKCLHVSVKTPDRASRWKDKVSASAYFLFRLSQCV